jgi:hypothetical protein
MATGVQLRDLITALRVELGHSLNVAQGVNSKEALAGVLKRVQEQLYAEHDWPMLMLNVKMATSQNVRFYTYPTEFDPEQVRKISALVASTWVPLQYGIQPEHYAVSDPDAGATDWPPQRWAHRPDLDQVELWPVPGSDESLYVSGQAKLKPFLADDDVCTLDGTLLVLHAAAELLARNKAEDASLKLQQSSRLLNKLLAKQGGVRREPWIVGGGDVSSDRRSRR